MWGWLPKGIGVCIVIGFAALGALATAGTGRDPGFLLGAFVVVGTLIAGLAVQPRGIYLIIPAPALCYVVTAVMAGLINDRSSDGSTAALALNGASWIGSGFIAMCIATGLAVVLTIVRWPRKGRRRNSGDDWDEPARKRTSALRK